MSFLDKRWLKSRYAELMVLCRHHPELKKDPAWLGEMSELKAILRSSTGEDVAWKVFKMYESLLANYSKGSLTEKQAHSKAIKYTAIKCDLTPQRVRAIVREWPKL